MSSLHEFLDKISTEIFYIQKKVYQINHYAQGLVAIYRLGAPVSCLLGYTINYLPHLEDANIFKQRDSDVTLDDMPSIRGKERGYHIIREFYRNLLSNEYNNSTTELIKGEFPKLFNGLAGAAFHGLIHTGYGQSVHNDTVVCEGLALMYYADKPLVVPEEARNALEWKLHDQKDPIAVVDAVKANASFVASLEKGGGSVTEGPRRRSRFGICMSIMLTEHGSELILLANQMPVPLKPETELLDRAEVGNFLVDLALTVYMASERVNDFFLLHGVTCAWAFREIIPILDDEVVNKSVRVFLACLLAAYVSQGSPKLLPSNLKIEEETLMRWDCLVEQTLSELDRDEHTYKVIQVCYDMFMAKPEKDVFYRKAAMIALNNKLAFVKSI